MSRQTIEVRTADAGNVTCRRRDNFETHCDFCDGHTTGPVWVFDNASHGETMICSTCALDYEVPPMRSATEVGDCTHAQDLTDEASDDGQRHPVATDVVEFTTMLDLFRVRVTMTDREFDGCMYARVETQNLDIPDHHWTLQFSNELDLS